MRRRGRASQSPITLFSFQDLITSLSGILILLVLLLAISISTGTRAESKPAAQAREVVDAERDHLRTQIQALQEEMAALRSNLATAAVQDRVAHALGLASVDSENRALQQNHEMLASQVVAAEKRVHELRERSERLQRERSVLQAEIKALQANMDHESDNEPKVFVIPEAGINKTPLIVECSAQQIRVGASGVNVAPLVLTSQGDTAERFAALVYSLSPESDYIVFMVKPSGVDTWELLMRVALERGFDVGYDALAEDDSIAFTFVPP
jgi:hypothetical protein